MAINTVFHILPKGVLIFGESINRSNKWHAVEPVSSGARVSGFLSARDLVIHAVATRILKHMMIQFCSASLCWVDELDAAFGVWAFV